MVYGETRNRILITPSRALYHQVSYICYYKNSCSTLITVLTWVAHKRRQRNAGDEFGYCGIFQNMLLIWNITLRSQSLISGITVNSAKASDTQICRPLSVQQYTHQTCRSAAVSVCSKQQETEMSTYIYSQHPLIRTPKGTKNLFVLPNVRINERILQEFLIKGK